MKRHQTLLSVAVSLICVIALSSAAQAAEMHAGTWVINLAKSNYDPAGLAPKSGTSKFGAADGGFSVVADGVDYQGKPTHLEFTVKYDGKDYPVKSNDPSGNDAVSMTKIDDYTFARTNKKGGKVTTTMRDVFGHDGKTRMTVSTGTDPQGRKVNSVVVYEKQ